MTTWTSTIATPSDIRERRLKGQIKSKFEDGTIQSVAKNTRTRLAFTLIWADISTTDKTSIESFFDSNLGGTFTWSHPITGVSYTVRFSKDEIEFTYVHHNLWSTTIEIEEQ